MRKRWLAAVSVPVLGAAAVFGFLGYVGRLGTNFREVVPGRFYRSGELSVDRLRDAVRRHGLKCVVNLQSAPKDWSRYEAQAAACKELGAEHAHIPISSGSLPTPAVARSLVERFRDGPYPMLVFCHAGSDRSGLASALFLMVAEGKPVDEAAGGQLTWRYGHFPITGTAAMDRFFELYRETSGGKDIADWVFERYPEIYAAREKE